MFVYVQVLIPDSSLISLITYTVQVKSIAKFLAGNTERVLFLKVIKMRHKAIFYSCEYSSSANCIYNIFAHCIYIYAHCIYLCLLYIQ